MPEFKEYIKLHWKLFIMLLLLLVLVVAFWQKCSYKSSGEQQDTSSSTTSSYVISQQQDKENKTVTTVSEKINGTKLDTVVIRTDKPIQGSIETVPRTYTLSINKSETPTGTNIIPVLTIDNHLDKPVTIEGQKLFIKAPEKKEPNGFIFKLFILVGLSLNRKSEFSNNLKPNVNIGAGVNLLKYNKFMFLSPSVSLNIYKDKNISGSVNIEPVKYNFYSNSSIGLIGGVDNRLNYNVGVGISLII